MKKLFLLIFGMLITLGMYSQDEITVVKGQPVLVYSLPKTELYVVVKAEKTVQQPGPYYQYSERYLATNDVIVDEQTNYRLVSLNVYTNTVPDNSRTYQVKLPQNNFLQNITVNSQGLLCGVNIKPQISSQKTNPVVFNNKKVQNQPVILPLGEEFMMAGSDAKLAEGAAKQIYRIRESRMSILTGDLDHMPADGASVTSMLKGLDKMEKRLTELFVGKTSSDTITKVLKVNIDSVINQKVLFRFSELKGIVASNDLSGTPYYLSVQPETMKTLPPDPKAKISKNVLNTLLPAKTNVTISNGLNTVYLNQFLMSQFGVVVPVDVKGFSNRIKIYVDPNTGRLLNISK